MSFTEAVEIGEDMLSSLDEEGEGRPCFCGLEAVAEGVHHISTRFQGLTGLVA
jgi:hypothetical protein